MTDEQRAENVLNELENIDQDGAPPPHTHTHTHTNTHTLKRTWNVDARVR